MGRGTGDQPALRAAPAQVARPELQDTVQVREIVPEAGDLLLSTDAPLNTAHDVTPRE